MAMQYSYMEKYEALYHYFSNIKPNFWQLPSVSDSLYLKLQKFTHFGLFGHIGSAIFHHYKNMIPSGNKYIFLAEEPSWQGIDKILYICSTPDIDHRERYVFPKKDTDAIKAKIN